MRSCTVGLLFHLEMLMRLRRHLRQMGHAQHLPIPAQTPQLLSHHFRHPAADAGVHFVENQRRDMGGMGGNHLNRQADPRQFPAGCDFGQWSQRLAGIGADLKFNRFQPGGRGLFQPLQVNGEAPARHSQARQRRRNPLAQFQRRCRPLCAQQLRTLLINRPRCFRRLLQIFQPGFAVFQRIQFRRKPLLQARQFLSRGSVLAGELVRGGQTLFDSRQMVGIKIERLHIIP